MTEEKIGSPVFICGYPKSGTTLLLALLDRHPQLLVFPEESKFFKLILGHPDRCNPEYILKNTGAKSLRLGEFRYASGYRDYSGVDFEVLRSFFIDQWSSQLQSEPILLETLMKAYGHATHQVGKKYWVEKTPLNEKYLHLVDSWWDNLAVIYIIPDPRDNFCSYRKLRQKRFDDLQRKLLQINTSIGWRELRKRKSSIQAPLSLDEFIAYWLESVHTWEKYTEKNPKCLMLRYEDLVNAPQETMEQVCSYLDITWDDVLMKPTRNGVYWSGNSVHGVEFKAISSDSVGRYKDLLSSDEIGYLEFWLNDVMSCYGYEVEQTEYGAGISVESLLKSNSKLSVRVRMIKEFLQSKLKNKEHKYA